MRTFEEIKIDLDRAALIMDAGALLRHASELDDIDTPQAEAESWQARGLAHSLRGDHLAALDHYHRALALHEELGNRSSVATVTRSIGSVNNNTGNLPAALEHLHLALDLYEQLGDSNGVAGTVCNIGLVYSNKGSYSVALEHFHRALSHCEELGNRHFAANITGNIGIVHKATGNYPAALEYYHRALALHEVHGNRNAWATVMRGIGAVYLDTGDYASALEHFHRAMILHEELGDRSGVAQTTSNIGHVYNCTHDYTRALEHFHRALTLHEEIAERRSMADDMFNIGMIHGNMGDHAAALEHHYRTLTFLEGLGDNRTIAYVRLGILDVHVNWGSDAEAQACLQAMDAIQIDDHVVRIGREIARAALQEKSGDLDSAARTFQRALAEAQEHGLRGQQAIAHKALRDLALKQNSLAAYVEHNNEYTRITEEINGKDTATKLAMQAKQREIDAKDREHQRHLAVLHSTLPKHIADRVARGEQVNDHYDNAAVLFLDIVGFTSISEQLSSSDVVKLLDTVFSTLDAVCKNHDVVKIKTIGDSYMAVAFPSESASSEQRVASAALDMLQAISRVLPDLPDSLRRALLEDLPEGLQVRIGLHTGPVTAGIIGTERMQYDVWGDTVNVASRMESTSEPGRIHVSSSFALALSLRHQDQRLPEMQQGKTAVIPSHSEEHDTSSPFPVPSSLIPRGKMEIKGKGTMKTYWLESPLS